MPYTTTSDGTSLFYRDWGTGEPVLFCPAWGLSSVEFQYQMTHLVDNGLRAVSFDRRGHGRSDDPGRGYDFDTLADDLAAVIEHLDLHGVTLVGHSMAGGEIVRYLTRHGAERVRRVALIGAVLPSLGVDPADAEAVRRSWRRDFGAWLADNADAYLGVGLPGCEVSPLLRTWTLNDLLSTSLQAAIACNEALTAADFTAELRMIEVPTLIIHGDHDASIPVEIGGYRQAELIGDSKLVVYENAPHGLYLTHVERLNRDLLEFVRG
jgi:non-heme chloroperoxidase